VEKAPADGISSTSISMFFRLAGQGSGATPRGLTP